MPVPPIPKPGFLSHIRAKKPSALARRAEPSVEIVKRTRNKVLKPWMIVTAEEAFKTGGTIKTVAALLNVTEPRLSGWLAEADSEECEDALLLEFGHVARLARSKFIAELREAVKLHALTDGKVAMRLLEAYDPEMQPIKKIEAKVKVEGPSPETLDNLSEEDAWAYRELEKKRLGKG